MCPGRMIDANLCSFLNFLFVRHFLNQRMTNMVSIPNEMNSSIVSKDREDWLFDEKLSRPTLVFSSRLPASLVDRALLHILNTNGCAG